MTPEELDRILSEADEIVPSSGFAAKVMEGIERESSAPPPIRFPWQRAVPGFGAATALAVAAVVTGAEAGPPPAAVTWGAAATMATVATLAIVRRAFR